MNASKHDGPWSIAVSRQGGCVQVSQASTISEWKELLNHTKWEQKPQWSIRLLRSSFLFQSPYSITSRDNMQETLSQNNFNQIKKLKRNSTLSIILLRLILLLYTVFISKNLDWFNHFRQAYREYPQYVSISISLWRSMPSYCFTSAQGLHGNFRRQPSQ